MRIRLWRFISLLTMLALLASPFYLGGTTPATAADPADSAYPPGMRVVKPVFAGKSQALRALAPKLPGADAPSYLRNFPDRLMIPEALRDTSGTRDASLVQDSFIGDAMPAPMANFEAVNNINAVVPPDTQGDVGYDPATGTKYYVQWVNLSFQIWDVSDAANPVSLYGPAAGNTLWSGTGTLCEYNNDGDPITLFDPLAKRWLMSQFGLGFPDNFHQCIAISATADPTGEWYLYDYLTSTEMMNDYPKFGVWPDGYYMTINQFAGDTFAYGGVAVAVFDRDAMLLGQPARMVYIDVGLVNKTYYSLLPSDLDGPVPPLGAPNYFMQYADSSTPSNPQDTLLIWEFHIDWDNLANTTFGLDGSYAPNYEVPISDQDTDMCHDSLNCIPQPGTDIGLDALADRLMYRLQYRNFGDYETLLTNHTVDVDGNDWAGVHWFEVRSTGGGWSVYQEGVYAPDADNHWMASVAMDDAGNMGLGYSVASSTTYPSIRYTGRLAADPLGLMPQGEASLIEGSGSQLTTHYRWGDYSMMAVDPLDGCTFWYTQEYIQTTGNAPWQTRVGSFKFPSCTTLPTGTLTGTVTDGVNPLAAATVTATGEYSTVTDDNGVYTLELPAGDYDVTAWLYGYNPATATNITIAAGEVTTQDFVLEVGTTYTLSGVVTDAGTGWPLYARLDIFGYPFGPIFTDPLTGAYSVDMVEGPYNLTVNAVSGGYNKATASFTISGDLVLDFPLDVDLLECTAPGYIYTAPSFSEDFEVWPLANWSVVTNIVDGLLWDSSEAYDDGNYTGGDGLAADVNSDANRDVEYDTELISPIIETASLPNLHLVYKANMIIYSGLEALDLDISNDGGTTWTNLLRWMENHGVMYGTPGETVSIDLTPYAGESFQLRWHYYTPERDPYDYYVQIDEVRLGASCDLIPDSGLVVGGVYDANTGLEIAGPLVTDADLNPALLVDTTADPSQPNPLYIIGAPAGTVELTASADYYATDTQSPLVVAGSTVRQDFYLPAGLLAADPASLALTAYVSTPVVSQPVTLNNLGGKDANYQVFALPGVWAGYEASGPFAANTRHIGPKALNDRDASKLRVNTTPLDVPALQGGAVSASWDSGLPFIWGIGYNQDASDLWLGSPLNGGGDNLNHRFLTDGTNTGDTIDTTPWVSLWAADMAYNPFTGKLWQVNVGGDNCIYEMDPLSMLATGHKLCPGFGTSERGLAFDPLTYTYFAGSWNDGIINHFAPDGTLLDSVAVGLSTSGLAFNPSTGHLFVLTNHAIDDGTFDVYVLDTNAAYAILGGFNLMDGETKVYLDFDQAALELDCAGNLWAVDQGLNKVYVADSGETGVCDWHATWLSAAPDSGVVLAEDGTALVVTADATGLPLGSYPAYLRLVNDTPYSDIIIPVTLTLDPALFLPLVMK